MKRIIGPFRRVAAHGALGLLALLVVALPAHGQAYGQNAGETLQRLTIKSEVMGEERLILVRTPAGYERGKARFPVIYMTDGEAHLAHTASTLSFLARNGRVPEMIVVAIQNTDRTRDLTPTKANMMLPTTGELRFPTSGGADRFLKFIETELIPQIESKYRTQPFRVFAGHSFGGLFAVNALLTRPDLFNAYIAVSPSLQWDNEVMLKRAEEFFKSRKEFKKTLFFTLGNEPGGIGEGFVHFKELLARVQPQGFEWSAEKMDDEDHGSVVLRSHYAGLRKIFDGWQLPRDPATGEVAGGLAGAEAHYKKLSQKLGYTVAVPENLINEIGYRLLGAGKTEEAIAAFKTNVERYPQSANVYDSLAEAFEKTGRLDLARPNYEKAVALGGESSDPNLAVYKANLDRVSEKSKQNTNAAGGNK
ncbi:MAG TPA: alpha/beta hydrolase-fold protein [Pyrinomonadaceae bacterium]|nr:alpha/beta hydrolase-fold protein [Pyrinomonadaceae bacterium]